MGCSCGKEKFVINRKRFVVERRIAEGGFSVVDLMIDRTSGSGADRYAVKRITCHSLEDEKAALAEIKYHRILSHPNVLKLVDSAVINPSGDSSEYMLVLPYYKEGSLENHLRYHQKHGSNYSVSKVVEIFLGICSGLAHMHNHSSGALAHRDIKTGNVLLTKNDTPVLMDLGSAAYMPVKVLNRKHAQQLQDDAAEHCSILYRAPELFNVEPGALIGTSIDIWSLGCVLFALMFLENPFERCFSRGDSVALAAMGRNLKFPDHSTYPPNLTDLVLVCMSVEPDSRPDVSAVISRVQSIAPSSDSRRSSPASDEHDIQLHVANA